MLTGEEAITSGVALIDGNSVAGNPRKVFLFLANDLMSWRRYMGKLLRNLVGDRDTKDPDT